MSAVSYPLSSPSPEPVAPRRRAPEVESDREAAPFSLPEEPDVETKAAAAEASAEAKSSEPASTPAQQGTANSAPASPQSSVTKPAAVSGPAQPVPAEASVQPKPDVGALVAIAEAEQAAAGEAIAKPKKSDGEGAVVGDADGDEASAMPALVPDLVTALPGPTLPLGPELTPPAAAGGEASANASTETITPGLRNAAGQDAAPGTVAGSDAAILPGMAVAPALAAAIGEAASEPAQDLALPGGKKPKVTIAAGLSLDTVATAMAAAADPAGARATGTEKAADITAPGHAKTAKDGTAEASTSAAPASLSDVFKPVEAQQNPAAIDVSALVHSRAGKPEALAATPGLDPAANAQLQLANAHHGAADGQPTPLHVVPVEIGLRALAGSKRFDIRLDPAELGRIDVKLEISDKGEVSARLVVDRVETLHLLQRDARTLERAFEQAGLKPSDAGVDITLRDQSDQSGFRQNRQDEQAPRRASSTSEPEIDDITIAAQPTPIRRLVRLGGVDLSI